MTQKKMQELIREEKADYFKKWRAANKDRVKQHNENYWKKKAEQRLQNTSDCKEGESDAK